MELNVDCLVGTKSLLLWENMEKTLDELKVLCQRSLFEWFRCWGFTDSSSLSEFMFSIRLPFWFPSPLFCCLFHLFLVGHHREQLVLLSFFFLINNSSLFTYQKKGKKKLKNTKTVCICLYWYLCTLNGHWNKVS